MIGLLHILFMVRTFRIHQPNGNVQFIQAVQFNVDEYEHSHNNSPFDCIFEMKDDIMFPLGIQFIFSGWQYNRVLLKHDIIYLLLCIDQPLPYILCKIMGLRNEKWESFALNELLYHKKNY